MLDPHRVQFATDAKGKVQVYVQFKQTLPAGFERLGLWPADLFAQIALPRWPAELKAKK